MTRSEMETLLRRRGWKELPVSHAWKFQKPPLPAQYKLEDPIALEQSQGKNRTDRRLKGCLG
jgi:hypothetical protein